VIKINSSVKKLGVDKGMILCVVVVCLEMEEISTYSASPNFPWKTFYLGAFDFSFEVKFQHVLWSCIKLPPFME
jgi:hypothetical protein